MKVAVMIATGLSKEGTMKALLVCIAVLSGAIGAAGIAVAQDDAAALITSFQERLDERIGESGMELPAGARNALREKIREGVARLEEGGLERVEIAEAERTFELLMTGVLGTVQAARIAASEEATTEATQDHDEAEVDAQFGQEQQQETAEGPPTGPPSIHVQQERPRVAIESRMPTEEEVVREYCPPPRIFPWCVE